MRTVDLKQNRAFLDQYVDLRNTYADLLLTDPVTLQETEEWLSTGDQEIRGIVEGDVLLGAAVLYIDRKGEIAFFVKIQNRAVGSALIDIMETVACEKKISSIWAWVLETNSIARHVFEKKGFTYQTSNVKKFKNVSYRGIVYEKYIVDSRVAPDE